MSPANNTNTNNANNANNNQINPQNLVNNLMSMYNGNIRQIEHLQNINTGIRNDITTLLLRITNIQNTNRNRNLRTNNDLNIPITNLYNNQRENLASSINTIFQNFLDPVQIFPTQIQIENATRIVRFADIVRPINNSCPITMDSFGDNNFVSVIRECNHIFNTDSLNNWFRSNCRCPVCRYDIRNYNTPNTANTNTSIPNTANTPNINTSIPNISNVLYDSNTESITFDINNDDFYNSITRLALNQFNSIYNNNTDASGNNIYDASGNNTSG
jgi:hypothetical protein